MKYACLGLGLAVAFSLGCIERTIECKYGVVDTETSTLATGSGAFCRYDNPHGKGTDCRVYEGGWTEEEILLDCSDAMGQRMAKPGNLSDEDCSPADLVGTCTVDFGDGKLTTTYYYAGDAGALNSFCEANGVWTPAGPVLEGVALAMPEALQAMQSDTAVQVEPSCQDTDCLEQVIEGGDWFEFRPLGAVQDQAVIFFPGGAVDPRAYAPAARAFAEAGHFSVISPHYGSTAQKVADILSAHKDKKTWYLGGHSYGGITAVRYVFSQGTDHVAGLYLWGAHGVSVYDISAAPLDILVVSAENDGLTTSGKVDAGKKYLPSGAVYDLIEGGNHAYFGYYGDQEGDGKATITRQAQQQAAQEATLDLLTGAL